MSSRHKSKRRESRHQQWSEWEWNSTYQCDVRSRENNAIPGGVEWEYRQVPEAVPEDNYYDSVSTERASEIPDRDRYRTPLPDIPRYTPPGQVEQVSRQTSYSPPESYTYQRDDSFVDDLSRRFETTELSERTSYSDDKGKQPVYSTSSWEPNASSAPFASQQTSMYPQYSQGNPYPSQNYYPSAQSYSQGNTQLGHIQEDEQSTEGQPFASQYPRAPYQGNNYGNNTATNSYSNYNSQQYGYGAESSRDPNYIAGNDDLPEDILNPEYKLHYSKEFKFMRVFKMVWHETRGENNTFGTDTIYGKFKQPVNASIRRFVIIKAEKGHCLCLPILTYNKQGTTKRGLIVDHHGMIYTGKHAPELQPGEQALTIPSVRMIPRKDRDKLHAASRINYAKIYTVEHNVKCVFIGTIDEAHRDKVIKEYNKTVQI